MFDRVLVANRGEIAARIVSTLRDLGVGSVAVHSEEDRRQPHVRLADVSVDLGDGPPGETYLDVEAIVAAAVETGADAVHPGYGFLSEQPELPRALADAGITWIGPPPRALETLGDKARALALARELDVPVTPGSPGPVEDAAQAREVADEIGYPSVLKAVHGGGGMGMVRVEGPEAVEAAFEEASTQAQRAFGDPALLVERWWEKPRHVEVQVAADQDGELVHLFERECSLQRRHQKLVEEAPAPCVDDALRDALTTDALRLCQAAGVTCLATVEFLVTEDGYVFNEVNPRIQVEHPVTELVTGQDLVAWQVRLAAGEPLPLTQDELDMQGWAIEARVNAEDALADLAPVGGQITNVHVPRRQGLRVDHALVPQSRLSTTFDSLLAKVIGHGADRDQAIDRCRSGLAELRIGGVPTTAGLLHTVLGLPAVRAGALHTDLLTDQGLAAHVGRVRGAMATLVLDAGVGGQGRVRLDGHQARWELDQGRVLIDGSPVAPVGQVVGPGRLEVDGRSMEGGLSQARQAALSQGPGGAVGIDSPLSGRVDRVLVAKGEEIAAGQDLVVIEAMKMRNRVSAEHGGTVVDLSVTEGDQVEKGQRLLDLEPVS